MATRPGYLFDAFLDEVDDDVGVLLAVAVGQLRQRVDDRLRVQLLRNGDENIQSPGSHVIGNIFFNIFAALFGEKFKILLFLQNWAKALVCRENAIFSPNIGENRRKQYS
jgi:hypothetical protein